jgi:hypothetical protein
MAQLVEIYNLGVIYIYLPFLVNITFWFYTLIMTGFLKGCIWLGM